jgi:hypothetical protein
LRRRKGFGLLFIQASPAQAQELLQRLQTDLPQKTIGTLTLTEPITNLYNLVAERPDLADLNILFIQGIEKSLSTGFEKKHRRAALSILTRATRKLCGCCCKG